MMCTDKKFRCPAYCDCYFPSCMDIANHKGLITDMVNCRCGEEPTHNKDWQWHYNSETDVQILGNDIIFHPTYSQGTAIVRGENSLKTGMVHYWEFRILTVLAGTDVMFGIGTDHIELEQFKFHFVSALGINAQSWGYSYNGKIQHNGEQQPYGKKFSQGCLVGVLLDRVYGHLEFYLNRRPMGIAYRNIPNDPQVEIYPMVCSTAAKCAVRLINSTSQVHSLQLRSYQALTKQPKHLEELRQMPGLRNIMQAYWFLAPPIRYSQSSPITESDMFDEAVLSRQARRGRKQKYRDDEVTDINDLYTNAHKIANKCSEQSYDDDEHLVATLDLFDEYFHNYLL